MLTRVSLIIAALVIAHALGIEVETLMLLIVYIWPPTGPSLLAPPKK